MSIRLASVLFALVAAPAAAATVATPATLAEVLRGAAAGDTVTLAAGSYDAVAVKDRHWSPPVTVDAAAAQLRGVKLTNVSGLTWHGGTFDGGDVERYGISFYMSDHFVVDGATFHHFTRNGINLGLVSDARITNNGITDSGSDGIDVAMSRRIVLDHNRCADFHPTPGAHPDCIQMWSHAEQPPTADITLTNNEAIGDMQGFTAFNHIKPDATGRQVDEGGFDRIVVEYNHARVMTYHGVTINACRNCIVRHNRAETMPNPAVPRLRTWIHADGAGLIFCDNHAEAFPGGPGSERCRKDDEARRNTPSAAQSQ